MKRSLILLAAGGCALGLAAVSARAGTTYAIDMRNAQPHTMFVFPAAAPAPTVQSTTATFHGFAMDFDASATTLYGITNPATTIGTINQTTGAFVSNAAINGAGAAETNWSGLAGDPNGSFYASASGGAGSNRLYTIDPTTGLTALVGNINAGTAALNIDITIDRNGQMYGHDIAADKIFQIDKTNGNVTFLGAGTTGFNANFAQGMDFDWDTNILYATLYTGGGTGVYASVNTTTGAATSLANTQPWMPAGAELEMSVKAAIPEPATAAALLGGSAVAIISRRRRRS
jgi:hypothetical protein